MKKQDTIYAEKEVFDFAEKLAKENDRSKNYYLTKWIMEGFKAEAKKKKTKWAGG